MKLTKDTKVHEIVTMIEQECAVCLNKDSSNLQNCYGPSYDFFECYLSSTAGFLNRRGIKCECSYKAQEKYPDLTEVEK